MDGVRPTPNGAVGPVLDFTEEYSCATAYNRYLLGAIAEAVELHNSTGLTYNGLGMVNYRHVAKARLLGTQLEAALRDFQAPD